jgi:putative Holliday junction resolvase
MPDGVAQGTVLAFDFGTRRIGVAIGELMLGQARPLTTIAAEANDARFAAIGKLIAEWQPARLVVGLPLALDGTGHEMTDRARRFARQLEGRFRLPVVLVDERLTSTAADETLRSRGLGWRERKASLDAEAATTLLQSHFDEGAHETATPR